MNQRKIKVLYIAGPSRSGSTILSNILGEIDGFFNAGELIDIWDRGVAANGSCGCGAPMKDCEIWGMVLNQAFGSPAQIDIHEMIHRRDRAAHSSYVPWRMWIPGARQRFADRHALYLNTLKKLYHAIQSVIGCNVIIDSSKNVGYADILTMIPAIDLHIVHLIRDSRATAYSWRRKKEGLWRENPVKTSLVWNVRNIISGMLGMNSPRKYLRLFYEDFVRDPQEAILQILDLLREKESSSCLPFVSKYEVKLGGNHSVFGNPNRFQKGIFKLQTDDEWMNGTMKNLDKVIVTMLTWPLLMKYGYFDFSPMFVWIERGST
ncbi:MAG: hypothetical protein GWN00_29070 [Aliifodinibius sp.]|nr:sulfotransferase [Fodinibius sp.]NIV14824.1 hypothetical protein [Fodinibius sp.]NIY28703.1 hypothetical protein [Fodinibius sp.]